jgi:hypothetical protein
MTMDIVRQLRRTGAKVAAEREMALYTTWREDKELLYRAATEIEKLRSCLDQQRSKQRALNGSEFSALSQKRKETPKRRLSWLVQALHSS